MARKIPFRIKIILFLVTICLPTYPVAAMENAPDAPNDGRTLALVIKDRKGCTGFLYSERIVITAGHCVFNNELKLPAQDMSVISPGITYTNALDMTLHPVIKTFISENWDWHGEDNFSDKDDIAVLVLKHPLPIVGKTIIADQEMVENYLSNNVLVTTVGYGRQSKDHGHNDATTPKLGIFPLVKLDVVQQSLQSYWNSIGREKYYGMKIHIKQTPGGPSTCGGDSGSPLYVKQGEDFVYLGPLAWGIGGMPNCSGEPWKSSEMYVGSVLAYDFLSLIKLAEDYVVANPYVAPPLSKETKKKKISYSCISKNGKDIKGVYERYKVKCPKGYKKL